jgi:hypothetical protein
MPVGDCRCEAVSAIREGTEGTLAAVEWQVEGVNECWKETHAMQVQGTCTSCHSGSGYKLWPGGEWHDSKTRSRVARSGV